MGNCFCNKGLKKTVSWFFFWWPRGLRTTRGQSQDPEGQSRGQCRAGTPVTVNTSTARALTHSGGCANEAAGSVETGLAVSTQGTHPRNLPHVHTRLVHECSQQPKPRDVPKAGEKEPVTKEGPHTRPGQRQVAARGLGGDGRGCSRAGWREPPGTRVVMAAQL